MGHSQGKENSPQDSRIFNLLPKTHQRWHAGWLALECKKEHSPGWQVFYNNGQECSNFKYKSKVRERKMQKSTSYRPSMKCSSEEAIVIYKEMVEEVDREAQSGYRKGCFSTSGDIQAPQVLLALVVSTDSKWKSQPHWKSRPIVEEGQSNFAWCWNQRPVHRWHTWKLWRYRSSCISTQFVGECK